jgi:hypothetical protein
MQGCLKSAIVALQKSVNVEQEPLLYVAFFNFSVGLERLLKLNLILDRCLQQNGSMPTLEKKFCHHRVADLYEASERLFAEYGIDTPASCCLDSIDRCLIKFLQGFADKGRYFNLDDLTGKGNGQDPMPEWDEILKEIGKNITLEKKLTSISEIIWRLVKILCPMKELIFVLSQRFHSKEMEHLEVPSWKNF